MKGASYRELASCIVASITCKCHSVNEQHFGTAVAANLPGRNKQLFCGLEMVMSTVSNLDQSNLVQSAVLQNNQSYFSLTATITAVQMMLQAGWGIVSCRRGCGCRCRQ